MNGNAVNADLELVLLPGLDGTGQMFDQFIQHQPMEWQTSAIGYPGDRHTSYDELLEMIWERLPTNRPYVLLGESFSGPLAVRIAAQNPPGLQGLILCASFVTSPTPWLIRWPFLFSTSVVRRLIQLEAYAAKTFTGRCHLQRQKLSSAATHKVTPEVIAARVRETMSVNVTADLRQVQVPMLYLAANRDFVVAHRCMRLVRRHRPDLAVRVLKGPHALLQTCPREAWSAILDWRQEQSVAVSAPTSHTLTREEAGTLQVAVL